jgi:hypothetical protein
MAEEFEKLKKFEELKNKLSDLKVEKHKIDDLIDILLFKFKTNGELDKHEQENLKALCDKSEELGNKLNDIRSQIIQLHEESNSEDK